MQFILIREVLLHSSQKAKLEVQTEGYSLTRKALKTKTKTVPTLLSNLFLLFSGLNLSKRIYNIKSEIRVLVY